MSLISRIRLIIPANTSCVVSAGITCEYTGMTPPQRNPNPSRGFPRLSRDQRLSRDRAHRIVTAARVRTCILCVPVLCAYIYLGVKRAPRASQVGERTYARTSVGEIVPEPRPGYLRRHEGVPHGGRGGRHVPPRSERGALRRGWAVASSTRLTHGFERCLVSNECIF